MKSAALMSRLKEVNITQSEAMYIYIYIIIYITFYYSRDDVRENQARQLFINIFFGWKKYTEERRVKKLKYKEMDNFANMFRIKYAIEIFICNTENALNGKDNEVFIIYYYI